MDTADFDTSAAMFADDAVYLRPAYVPGQAAFESSGTARLEGFEGNLRVLGSAGDAQHASHDPG